MHRFGTSGVTIGGSPSSGSLRNSRIAGPDLAVLDKLVTSILQRQQQPASAISPQKLIQLRSMSRGSRSDSLKRMSPSGDGNGAEGGGGGSGMPTILETNNIGANRTSWSGRSNNVPAVRQIINTITNAPHRFSLEGGGGGGGDEKAQLTRNILD